MRFSGLFSRVAMLALVLSGGWPAAAVSADAPLEVYVVNYPLQYFATRIGGEHAHVVFPAPADVDPAFWRPSTDTVAAYQSADLILLNGADYAKWLNVVSLPGRKLVNTSAQLKDRYIQLSEAFTHSHGGGAEHSHGGVAFTTWLDLDFAAAQARRIAEAFSRARPEQQQVFEGNLATLVSDLMALDRELRELSKTRPGLPFIGSHPVYDYLARRYGLNIHSVHWEPDQVPAEQAWENLQSMLQSHPAGWMIWEGEPVAESVEKLQQIGVQSLVFDPCGNRPNEGDFLSVMRGNVAGLKKAFQAAQTPPQGGEAE